MLTSFCGGPVKLPALRDRKGVLKASLGYMVSQKEQEKYTVLLKRGMLSKRWMAQERKS